MVSGENHYFLGQPYQLQVVEQDRPAKVFLQDSASILLSVRPGANIQQRAKILYDWYREQLRTLLPTLLEKWQIALGVTASDWGIKKMKTRWGTCNIRARRVWINLELAKKPIECLEYIVVHELLHLVERRHSERFHALMDKYLPTWRSVRELLNSVPLAHDACLC
jgi:predicted metal-dependent hydrolase